MARYYVDCRDYPSETNCTVALAADSKEELLEAAMQHAVHVHGYEDTAEVRAELQGAFKEGTPPE